MDHLQEASDQIQRARDKIQNIRVGIKDTMDGGQIPGADTFLQDMSNQLYGEVVDALDKAQNAVISMDIEHWRDKIESRLSELNGLMASVATVTTDDVNRLDDTTKVKFEQFANNLAGFEPQALNSNELEELIKAFQQDIADQRQIGDQVARVVSVVTKVGRTAVKVLSPLP